MPHCQLINVRLCVAFGTARYADSAVPVDASRPSWPRWLIGLCLILSPGVLPAEAHAAGQIEIEYADWGFDGRAVPRTFNLLTLGIQNLTAEPFEGTLRCRRVLSAAGGWSGAEILQDVYIGPNSVREVQVYPYMLDEGEVWEIRWGDGLEDTFLTERPQLTSGSRVILNDPISNSGIQQGLKGFSEDWFPVSVLVNLHFANRVRADVNVLQNLCP